MIEKILKKTESLKKLTKTAAVIIIILFVLALSYGVYSLFTREPDPFVLEQKEEELKASDIKYDQKTIDKAKNRKGNGLPLDLSGLGRDNPFMSF